MGVFHVFKIVQMVPNRATHHIFAIVDVMETPKCFEEIILAKQNSSFEPIAKKSRRKAHLKVRVVTSEQFLNVIKEKEAKKKN